MNNQSTFAQRVQQQQSAWQQQQQLQRQREQFQQQPHHQPTQQDMMQQVHERQAQMQEQNHQKNHPYYTFGYPGVHTPPFSPNPQPWNGYPHTPSQSDSIADIMQKMFKDMRKSDSSADNTQRRTPTKPINDELVFISDLFNKLCAQCDDTEVTKWFWVDTDYVINMFQSGEFDNGVWHEDGAHAYRTITRDVVITTPTFKFIYRPTGDEMAVKGGNDKDITPEIITSGLIPVLKLIAYLCTRNEEATVHPEPQPEPAKSTSVPPKRRRKISKTKQMEFRAEVDSLVSDDDAMDILDVSAQTLYNVIYQYESKALALGAPAGQLVQLIIDLNTLDMRITCGTQTIYIPRCDHTRPISEYIEIDVKPTTQTEDIAAILSAIYIWSQANDIRL